MNRLKFLAIISILVCLGACSSDDDSKYLGDYTILAGYSEDYYPTDTDNWVITDDEAVTSNFAGLNAAIEALSGSGREISLSFPNLDTIPNYAIFGKSSENAAILADVIVSVSADVATSVGERAFAYCSSMTYADFPSATTVKEGAFLSCTSLETVDLSSATIIEELVFYSCTALESIYLATNSGVKLEDIDYTAFYFATPESITLTLGSSNSGYVSGNTLTVDDFSATFMDIIYK